MKNEKKYYYTILLRIHVRGYTILRTSIYIRSIYINI